MAWAVASVDAAAIDEINILARPPPGHGPGHPGPGASAADFALIDGDRDKGITLSTPSRRERETALSANIAAASILAKVSRDRYMEEMASALPGVPVRAPQGLPHQAPL